MLSCPVISMLYIHEHHIIVNGLICNMYVTYQYLKRANKQTVPIQFVYATLQAPVRNQLSGCHLDAL